ncbi:MAG TPA: ATP-binding protein [Prosthecobacter sp.]|nr:ATP-binding protein [Prosthecobacter sp.]
MVYFGHRRGVLMARSSRPLKLYLVLLVLGLLVPAFAFSGILLWRYQEAQSQQVELDLREDVRLLAAGIERELIGLEASLLALTTSNGIRERDYAAFHRRALAVKQLVGFDVLLRDLDGQQLANTRVPYGTPLPLEPVEGDAEVIAHKRAHITGLIVGAVAKKPLFTITAPVLDEGEVTHFLNLSLPLERLTELLKRSVTPGRLAGVTDANGFLIARTERMEALLGTRATAQFAAASQGNEGIARGISREGIPSISAYVRMPKTGWRVWVSVPEALVFGPRRNALVSLLALGGGFMLIGLGITLMVARRLAGPVHRLSLAGISLQKEEVIAPMETGIREVDDVSRALSLASVNLAARTRELRQLNATLEARVDERTKELTSEIERRHEAESQLRQAQKIEALGQLSGGVAHDFNNMLAVILGNMRLLKRRMTPEPKLTRLVDNAIEGGERAAKLTRHLLAFSRRQALEPTVFDVNQLITRLVEMIRSTILESVEIETVFAAGAWRVHADANQLQTALLNLVVNAQDAMPRGGKLTIETANAHLDEAYAARFADVAAGQYLMIAVVDTGTGMLPDVVQRAFDPFFTTKPPGSGTGMGLSQVHGFIKQSGGHVSIHSEPGCGTAVKLYLPRHIGSSQTAGPDSVDSRLPPADPDQLVLVVEDSDSVREVTVAMVHEIGYRALAAASGREALQLLDANPDITVLFTDVVMPEMDGRQLADEALRRRPALKILFTTGYTRNAIVHNGVLDLGVQLLSKPFTPEMLARKLAEIVQAQTRAAAS